jgi:hypothetical protein
LICEEYREGFDGCADADVGSQPSDALAGKKRLE